MAIGEVYYQKLDAIYIDTQSIQADTTDIKRETNKIDITDSSVFEGSEDSLAFMLSILRNHIHSYESWFEVAATPSMETHVADRVGDGNGSFQCDAGNDDWGAWVQIIGSSDTPIIPGNTKFDLHRIQITAAERNAQYYIQIGFDSSGAAALSNNNFSDIPFKPQSVQGKPAFIIVQNQEQDVGTKTWIRCKCPGQNTATIDMIYGLHGYEG